MASTTPSLGRQFRDVFDVVASGWATASPGAVANNAAATVAITVPGVTADGTWEVIAETCSATNVSGFTFSANVSAANTVTFVLYNSTGGSVTPTAGAKYTVVVGKLNTRFTS